MGGTPRPDCFPRGLARNDNSWVYCKNIPLGVNKARVYPVHHYCYHDAMERTTISLPEELLERLRLIAAERRTSMAALIREAVEEKVRGHRPRPRSWGIGASGYTDTASKAGNIRPEPRSWR